MKARKIAPITINENASYSVDEEWVTIDSEGFFSFGNIVTQQKLSILKEKVNEIIDKINELVDSKTKR